MVTIFRLMNIETHLIFAKISIFNSVYHDCHSGHDKKCKNKWQNMPFKKNTIVHSKAIEENIIA